MINEVNKTKCSATLLENRLTRKQHIVYVFGKISSGIGMIIKGHPYVNKQELISNYYSFIYPYLNYYNYIWGSTYKTSLKRLITCQNKAIWIIAHAIMLWCRTAIQHDWARWATESGAPNWQPWRLWRPMLRLPCNNDWQRNEEIHDGHAPVTAVHKWQTG